MSNAIKKKKSKNKLRAWLLAIFIFAAVAVGSFFIIKDQISGDGAYKREIKKKYEQVEITLIKALEVTDFDYLLKSEITHIQFLEPSEEEAKLEVFYKGNFQTSMDLELYHECAVFNSNIEDYNNLVDAEESGNMLEYLDCLNEVFINMTYDDNYLNDNNTLMELKEDSEENREIFNNVFGVDDVKTDDIVKQVGFTPFHIQLVKYELDPDTKELDYTYQITGISYCETVSESTANVVINDRTIMNSSYDSTHLKAFNRQILFSTSIDNVNKFYEEIRLQGDILKIIDGVNEPYTVETVYFEDTSLFDPFEKMMRGNFDFKRPKGLDVREYLNKNK